MLDQGFLKSHFVGRDGFIWWIGQIAPKETWQKNFGEGKLEEDISTIEGWGERYRVRIMGYHTANKIELPDEELPFATVIYPVTAGAGAGFSQSSNIVAGNFVFGFFMDGEDAQQPVIMGVIGYNEIQQIRNVDPGIAFVPYYGVEKKPGGGKLRTQQTRVLAQETSAFANSDTPTGSLANNYDIVGVQGEKGLIKTRQNHSNAFATKNSQPDKLPNADAGVLPIKTIQLELRKAIQTIEELKKSIRGVGAEQIDNLESIQEQINLHIKNASEAVAAGIKWVYELIEENILKKINHAFENIYFAAMPNERESVSLTTSSILDNLSCVFRKIFAGLVANVSEFVTATIDKVVNVPICFVEKFVGNALGMVGGVLNGVMDEVKEAIGAVTDIAVDGLDLVGDVFDMISNIISFLSCDNFPENSPIDMWSHIYGGYQEFGYESVAAIIQKARNIGEDLDNVSVFELDSFELDSFSNGIFDLENIADECSTEPEECGPPIVTFYGTKGAGAEANLVINASGEVIGADVVNYGTNYDSNTRARVVDKCGIGVGAVIRPLFSTSNEKFDNIQEEYNNPDSKVTGTPIYAPESLGFGNYKEVENLNGTGYDFDESNDDSVRIAPFSPTNVSYSTPIYGFGPSFAKKEGEKQLDKLEIRKKENPPADFTVDTFTIPISEPNFNEFPLVKFTLTDKTDVEDVQTDFDFTSADFTGGGTLSGTAILEGATESGFGVGIDLTSNPDFDPDEQADFVDVGDDQWSIIPRREIETDDEDDNGNKIVAKFKEAFIGGQNIRVCKNRRYKVRAYTSQGEKLHNFEKPDKKGNPTESPGYNMQVTNNGKCIVFDAYIEKPKTFQQVVKVTDRSQLVRFDFIKNPEYAGQEATIEIRRGNDILAFSNLKPTNNSSVESDIFSQTENGEPTEKGSKEKEIELPEGKHLLTYDYGENNSNSVLSPARLDPDGKYIEFDDNPDNGFDINSVIEITGGNAKFKEYDGINGHVIEVTNGTQNVNFRFTWDDNPDVVGQAIETMSIIKNYESNDYQFNPPSATIEVESRKDLEIIFYTQRYATLETGVRDNENDLIDDDNDTVYCSYKQQMKDNSQIFIQATRVRKNGSKNPNKRGRFFNLSSGGTNNQPRNIGKCNYKVPPKTTIEIQTEGPTTGPGDQDFDDLVICTKKGKFTKNKKNNLNHIYYKVTDEVPSPQPIILPGGGIGISTTTTISPTGPGKPTTIIEFDPPPNNLGGGIPGFVTPGPGNSETFHPFPGTTTLGAGVFIPGPVPGGGGGPHVGPAVFISDASGLGNLVSESGTPFSETPWYNFLFKSGGSGGGGVPPAPEGAGDNLGVIDPFLIPPNPPPNLPDIVSLRPGFGGPTPAPVIPTPPGPSPVIPIGPPGGGGGPGTPGPSGGPTPAPPSGPTPITPPAFPSPFPQPVPGPIPPGPPGPPIPVPVPPIPPPIPPIPPPGPPGPIPNPVPVPNPDPIPPIPGPIPNPIPNPIPIPNPDPRPIKPGILVQPDNPLIPPNGGGGSSVIVVPGKPGFPGPNPISIVDLLVVKPGGGYLSGPDGRFGGDGRVYSEVCDTRITYEDGSKEIPAPPGTRLCVSEGDTVILPSGTQVITEQFEGEGGNEIITGGNAHVMERPGCFTAPVCDGRKPQAPNTYPVIMYLCDVYIKKPGFNYRETDEVRIEPSMGAEARLVVDKFGRISDVVITKAGSGFQVIPKITVISDFGQDAELLAKLCIDRVRDVAQADPDKIIQVIDCVGKFNG